AVLGDQRAAIRAETLREAADAIDRETQQAKNDGVLEPDKFRPCRDASAQLRAMAAEAQQPGHVYLSTGCLHGEHAYCANVDGIAGLKKPAQCKFCAAPCTCPCHTEQQPDTETLRTAAVGPAPKELHIRVLREVLARMDGSRGDGDSATEDVGAATVRTVLVEILAGMQPTAGRAADTEAQQPETEAPSPVHAVPLPGSNGISSCCGRPPCEFVGERVTRNPDEVTCTGRAVPQQPAAADTGEETDA
ncbi:hypothetical protein MQN93_42355, partial [Streptomyces sp. 7R016]|nr:hypothetical protein [Streptomyces spinosisporus]